MVDKCCGGVLVGSVPFLCVLVFLHSYNPSFKLRHDFLYSFAFSCVLSKEIVATLKPKLTPCKKFSPMLTVPLPQLQHIAGLMVFLSPSQAPQMVEYKIPQPPQLANAISTKMWTQGL